MTIGSNGTAGEHVYPNVVEGIVEARNDRGIRINGEWLNVSRFKPVELPDVGVVVRLKVQPKGYINSIEILAAAPSGTHNSGSTSPPTVSRDRVIARLAILKAAAHFAATRTDIKSADVLAIAKSWEKWALDS
jgi:hypothetical protein